MARNQEYYQNRINLLMSRGKENGRIIDKLKRKIRLLNKKSV